MSEAWQKQVDWMRANGVTKAEWSGESLVRCELAAAPATDPAPPMSADAYRLHLEEMKRKADEEIDRLDFGAA